ncbi:MAG: superoxide dismutase, partial [Parcubacteria group bacterium]|nr:superoxide dismutase [Parcubacteria group bacterium]
MYSPQSFDHLLGTPGFSETLLKNHFTLYQGYVNNTNKASDLLAKLDPTSYEYAEVKRRFGWEFNGMRLHELYFGNLKNGGTPLAPASTLATQISADFGSVDNWVTDFKASGTMRGIGWVVLTYDQTAKR